MMTDPFAPTSKHGIALAERAARENLALIERRKTASPNEKKNLSGIRGIQEGRSGIPQVNPFKIKVRPGFNARIFDSAEAIEDDDFLFRSIKAKGWLDSHPAEVEIGEDGVTLWLIDGERRFRATIRAINDGAQIETVPVKTVPAGSNEADLVASQLMHNSGRRYGPLELGSIIKKLMGYGWTPEKIEADTSVAITRQRDVLEICALPPEAHDVIKTGAASVALVVATFKKHGKTDGLARIKEASAVAASNGRTRAMPRDIGEQTDRTFVRQIFENAEVSRDVGGSVSVTFAGEAFEALSKRYGFGR